MTNNRTTMATVGLAAFMGLLPLAAMAQDDDEGDMACAGLANQAEISECAANQYQISEEQLTYIYGVVVAVQGEPLRVSQRAWIGRRDADCEAERAVFDGGSGEGSALGLCVARWNIMRSVGLQTLNQGEIAIAGLDAYDTPD